MRPKELLVDTCGLVKWMQGTLPDSTRSLLIDAAMRHFSVVSAWEIQLKPELRNITSQDIEDAIRKLGMQVVPLLLDHISALATVRKLPKLPHKDPFDHLLIAQALLHGWPILTCDEAIQGLSSHPDLLVGDEELAVSHSLTFHLRRRVRFADRAGAALLSRGGIL